MPLVIDATPSGTYVVSFTDITPPVRYDDVPWTTVQIQQATSMSGPWTVIDSQTLAIADADPSSPSSRSITTSLATSQDGFFTLTFLDGAGASSQPIMQVMNQPSEIRPTVGELGAFMRARTVIAGSAGTEAGTFLNGTVLANGQVTGNTRPTATEAEKVIDLGVNEVLMSVGADIPDRFVQQAKFAVLLYAAQLVEVSFYRNEVNKDQSAYPQYQQLYAQAVKDLGSAIADVGGAAPEVSFFSVPIMSESQAHVQAMLGARNPTTGAFDASLLPIPEWFPRGPGLGPNVTPAQYAAMFGTGWNEMMGGGDFEIDDLESNE